MRWQAIEANYLLRPNINNQSKKQLNLDMIKVYELTIGNLVEIGNKIGIVTDLDSDGYIYFNVSPNYEYIESVVNPVQLTLEILKNNLGFEISDLGDCFECKKDDFILIKTKSMLGIELPFMFVIQSSLKGGVQIEHVHHLQNLYYDLKLQKLQWHS